MKLRDHDAEIREALGEVLDAARRLLEQGTDAVDVVKAAVTIMEDFELFNSGRGAALCSDGSAQLSASVMLWSVSDGTVR